MVTLFVVPTEDAGGVTTVVQNLATHFRSQGHEVSFFHPGQNMVLKARTTRSGFPGVRLRLCVPFAQPRPVLSTIAFPFLFPVILFQLFWLLRKHRFQIINLHYPIDNFFYFGICRYLLSIRLVTSLHGGDAFLNAKPRRRYTRAFRFLIHSSDLVILPSDAYRKKFVGPFPCAEPKTSFIHNGIDLAQFVTPERQERNDSRYMLC